MSQTAVLRSELNKKAPALSMVIANEKEINNPKVKKSPNLQVLRARGSKQVSYASKNSTFLSRENDESKINSANTQPSTYIQPSLESITAFQTQISTSTSALFNQ